MLRIAFIVQGEGRGHMTQALALCTMLTDLGHDVVAAFIGTSDERPRPPRFFMEDIGCEVFTYDAPTFVQDKNSRGVRMGATLWQNTLKSGRYIKSVRRLHDQLTALKPDLILSFYELITGLYTTLHTPPAPVVSVGHQYFLQHSSFVYPDGSTWNRRLMSANTRWSARGSVQRWALSYYVAPDRPAEGLFVMPPILREELFQQPLGVRKHFLLVYLINKGYVEQIRAWHRKRSFIPVHVFRHDPDAPDIDYASETLTLHQLSGEKFLRMMAECRGLVCTAGFESTSEAMYLGKPVYMRPVDGHYEQHCNAFDAVRAGAGLSGSTFELDRLLDHLYVYEDVYDERATTFRTWVAQAPTLVDAALRRLFPVRLTTYGDGRRSGTPEVVFRRNA